MNDHVKNWLDAYYDDALDFWKMIQVENHLAECAECRQTLYELQTLSGWLAEMPPAPTGISAETFVSRVILQLPREQPQQSQKNKPERTWHMGWYKVWQAVPFGLFGLWVVFQTATLLTDLVKTVLQLGLDEGIFSSLLIGVSNASGPAFIPSQPESLLNIAQWIMNIGSNGPFGGAFIIQFLVLLIIGFLYWSWMASWWVRHNSSPLANQ